MIGDIHDSFFAFIANQTSFEFYIKAGLFLVIFLSTNIVHNELQRPGIPLVTIGADQAQHCGLPPIPLYPVGFQLEILSRETLGAAVNVVFAAIFLQLIIPPIDITQLAVCHTIRNAADSGPEMGSVVLDIVSLVNEPKHDVVMLGFVLVDNGAERQIVKREFLQRHIEGREGVGLEWS